MSYWLWFQGVWWQAGLQWNGFCSFLVHVSASSKRISDLPWSYHSPEVFWKFEYISNSWNSTFLNLFSLSLSLPQMQIIGYRGVVIGKRLERRSKRPSTTAFWYKWIDYFKVWKLFLSLLLENTSVNSITLIPKQRESLPLLGHDCAPSSWNRASTGPNGCGPWQSSHTQAPSFRPGLDTWATGIPTQTVWAQFQSLCGPDLFVVLVFEADGKVHLCSPKPSDAKG